MNEIPVSTVIRSFTTLLIEAYAGPPDPSSTWFIDNEPDTGILGILKNVSAAEASQSVDQSGKSGTTIASHVEHLRWSLANLNATIRGAAYSDNWSESWELNSADETGWNRLRDALRAEYETLRETVSQQQELSEDHVLGLFATVTHAAFHLGVLRQMIERVQA